MPSSSFTRCRTFGHAWFDIDADTRPIFGVYLWLKCERCDTIRKDIIDPSTGELRSRSYQYPPGYQYASAEDRPTMLDFRRMVLADRMQMRRAARKAAMTAAPSAS